MDFKLTIGGIERRAKSLLELATYVLAFTMATIIELSDLLHAGMSSQGSVCGSRPH